MKSKGPSKGLLKIIAMTSMAVFTLFGAFAGSVAWFNTIQTMRNGADQMAIGVTRDLKEIRIYSATSANVETGYAFSTTPTQTITVKSPTPTNSDWEYQSGSSSAVPYSSAPAVPMNPQIIDPSNPGGSVYIDDPFSPISPYHPILMVIEYREPIVDEDNQGRKITMETENNFLTPARSTASQATNDLPAYVTPIASDTKFPLSSLVQTYAKGYASASDIPFQYALTDAQVTASKPKLSTLEHGSFASLSMDANNDPIVVFNKAPTIYSGISQTEVTCVAVILEYYVEVIEYIYSYYVGAEALEYNHDAFCDWRMLV